MAADPVEVQIAATMQVNDLASAATAILRAYGPAILGYLDAIVRDEDDAAEVFSIFSEDLWKGMRGFRGDCSAKTWAYKISWNAAMRYLGSPHRKRFRRLRTGEASAIAAEIVTTSASRSAVHSSDALRKLRELLTPEEQTLLILRLDRRLSWNEVGIVMSTEAQPVDGVMLRKRFARLKVKLGALARKHGILAASRESAR
jgi:RNA polymerase sigma-70 factor (ECF subfamily)